MSTRKNMSRGEAKVAKKILALRKALRGANDICRSMYCIVAREGRETNWEAFRAQILDQLLAQELVLSPSPTSQLRATPRLRGTSNPK